jgi:hypothetical protein
MALEFVQQRPVRLPGSQSKMPSLQNIGFAQPRLLRSKTRPALVLLIVVEK